MKRKLTLLVTALLTLAMIFTMSSSIFAEDDAAVVINKDPWVIEDLTLNAATYGVGLDGTGEASSYKAIYKYSSQTDGLMDLEIVESKHDLYPQVGKYEIRINNVVVTPEAAKAYPLGKGEYTFEITRTYPAVQANPYIAISLKALPTDITVSPTTEFTASESGTNYLTRFYKFTPAKNGGYELTIDGLNESTLANQFVQIAVDNKTGKKLNESATLDDGQKTCTLRVYLYGGTEYVISVRDEKVNMTGSLAGMKYTFKMKEVPSSEGLSVSGAKALSLDAVETCSITPFINKRAFAWYSFTAAEEGYYEFQVKEKATSSQLADANDIIVEIRDADFSPAEEEDQMTLYSGEGGTIIKRLREGETCYMQVCELYKGCLNDTYSRDLVVRKHTHTTKAIVDGDHVTLACPCMEESHYICDFWLDDVAFNNAAYNGGEEVLPTPKFSIAAWSSKDDKKPVIPATAYTIKVTSKNKTEIGKAKAKLTFVGEYEDLGTFTASFKIVPEGTTVSAVTPATKALTVKWAKQSKKTTGYQIQYSTSSKFSGAKTITLTKNKTTSKQISKLKSGKTYYVRVRTYKKIGTAKYYSAWSSAMSAKTK